MRLGLPVVCVLALAALPATAQPPDADVDAYLALLGRYEAGDYQGAAEAAARLDPYTARAQARLILDDVAFEMVNLWWSNALTRGLAPIGSSLNQLRRERVRRLKLTLLVHTEAALSVSDVKTFGEQLMLAREALARLRRLDEDDRRINGPLKTSEDEPGKKRSDEAPLSREPRAALGLPDPEAMTHFIRDWYLVVTSRLQLEGHLAFLKKHVTEGLELLKDDPELLLARGAISEASRLG